MGERDGAGVRQSVHADVSVDDVGPSEHLKRAAFRSSRRRTAQQPCPGSRTSRIWSCPSWMQYLCVAGSLLWVGSEWGLGGVEQKCLLLLVEVSWLRTVIGEKACTTNWVVVVGTYRRVPDLV